MVLYDWWMNGWMDGWIDIVPETFAIHLLLSNGHLFHWFSCHEKMMPFQKDLSFDERGRFGLGRSEKAKNYRCVSREYTILKKECVSIRRSVDRQILTFFSWWRREKWRDSEWLMMCIWPCSCKVICKWVKCRISKLPPIPIHRRCSLPSFPCRRYRPEIDLGTKDRRLLSPSWIQRFEMFALGTFPETRFLCRRLSAAHTVQISESNRLLKRYMYNE